MSRITILLLADTHLGFDLPWRPKVARRRRGHDFFANFGRVLEAAVKQQVHAVVHAGDLLFRSRVPARLVHLAFAPLKRVADSGIPVFLVPGNHERSRIPHSMLAQHGRLHVFDRARTFVVEVGGARVALAGFPFCREGVRARFTDLVESTGWRHVGADCHLLCVHQSFDGATVGPGNYTFRYASDVVDITEVPARFAAVLAGHIHRHQVLTTDLLGRALGAPVLYPGSIERTSYAERDEPKGYLVLTVRGELLEDWSFLRLPARAMLIRDIDGGGIVARVLESRIRHAIASAAPDAVLRIRIHGRLRDDARASVSAPRLRSWAPPTMNIEAVLVDERRDWAGSARGRSNLRAAAAQLAQRARE